MKVKKRKLKIKKKSIIIFIIIIIALFSFNPIKSVISLKNKGYDLSSAIKIYKLGIKSKVLDNDYSKTLDNIVTTDYYDKNYLDEYLSIKYIDDTKFNENISTWLKLNYDDKQINRIYEINNPELNSKLKEIYVKDITSYLEYDYFKVEKLERYINYFNGDYSDTIIKVNIGLDKNYYENPVIVKDYNVNVLVNKYNQLDSSFEPKDITELTKCSGKGESLSLDAKLAYDELCEASLKDGMSLGVTSSYRSYESQQKIYNSYLKSNGQEYVDKYVALPGYSEHQTGLALDVKSLNASPFKITNEYKWMINNAYKYGFILRYPEEKADITGYNAEAWHFRYVGKEAADYIYKNNITYDEYCAIFM